MTVAESFFLAVLTEYLDGVDLTPAPAIIGVAEPEKNTELPAIVLSLETTARVNPGLGERAQLIVGGILPWQVEIDLANPFIDGDTTFPLVNETRRQLILPHGGLMRADGSDPGDAPLASADITVSVDNASRTVVTGEPGANQVRAIGSNGVLTFGDALPVAGTVRVRYILGQWEQRLERIAGTLRVDVCAADGDDAASLSDGVVTALLDPAARRSVRRLIALSPTSLSSIGLPEQSPKLRRRTARMTFSFEREINRPDSSGGIIRRIDATSRMSDGLDPPGIVPQSSEPFTIPA